MPRMSPGPPGVACCRSRCTPVSHCRTSTKKIPVAALRARASGPAERFDRPRQHDHRHAAALHDHVVELTQVELRSERLLRLETQAVDLAVADLVAAGLSWPGAVTLHFARHLVDP